MNSTRAFTSVTSQGISGCGAAVKLAIVDSSDDELSFPIVKSSARTNAFLDIKNVLGSVVPPLRYQDGRDERPTWDSAGRVDQTKLTSTIHYQQQWGRSRISNTTGNGLSRSENTRPRRIVRIKLKTPGGCGASTPGHPQCSPPRLRKSEGRSRSSDGTPRERVTPARPNNSNLKVQCSWSSTSGSRRAGSLGLDGLNIADENRNVQDIPTSAWEVQNGSLIDYAVSPDSSNIPRSTKSSGNPIRGPARRIERIPFDDLSSSHQMMDAYGGGNVEDKQQDQFLRNSAAKVCYLTKSSSGLRRDRPEYSALDVSLDLSLEYEQENEYLPSSLRNGEDLKVNNAHKTNPPTPELADLEIVKLATSAVTPSGDRKRAVQITVNGNAYQRLDCIGKGGSCRVYRVMSENFQVWALKKVSFAALDEHTVRGLKGEIELLRTLVNVDRVVQLRDWEVNDANQTLSMVRNLTCDFQAAGCIEIANKLQLMEFGEVDLDTILKRRVNDQHAKFDAGFTQFYWKEMLECVAAVHACDVVHSDLKPANFLLVKGCLKLIDFGIANVIQDDTINIHRDHQVGTPNFMAPEALTYTKADTPQHDGEEKLVKLGKPSDIWSLGCILYQMVYGKPPFAHCKGNIQKAMAITDPHYVISYPSRGIGRVHVPPGYIRVLKACLTWDQCQRPVIDALLAESDKLLYPDYGTEDKIEIRDEGLGEILQSVIEHCRTSGLPTDAEVASWQRIFFNTKSINTGETSRRLDSG
jgi:serine/threonine protein kinase